MDLRITNTNNGIGTGSEEIRDTGSDGILSSVLNDHRYGAGREREGGENLLSEEEFAAAMEEMSPDLQKLWKGLSQDQKRKVYADAVRKSTAAAMQGSLSGDTEEIQRDRMSASQAQKYSDDTFGRRRRRGYAYAEEDETEEKADLTDEKSREKLTLSAPDKDFSNDIRETSTQQRGARVRIRTKDMADESYVLEDEKKEKAKKEEEGEHKVAEVIGHYEIPAEPVSTAGKEWEKKALKRAANERKEDAAIFDWQERDRLDREYREEMTRRAAYAKAQREAMEEASSYDSSYDTMAESSFDDTIDYEVRYPDSYGDPDIPYPDESTDTDLPDHLQGVGDDIREIDSFREVSDEKDTDDDELSSLKERRKKESFKDRLKKKEALRGKEEMAEDDIRSAISDFDKENALMGEDIRDGEFNNRIPQRLRKALIRQARQEGLIMDDAEYTPEIEGVMLAKNRTAKSREEQKKKDSAIKQAKDIARARAKSEKASGAAGSTLTGIQPDTADEGDLTDKPSFAQKAAGGASTFAFAAGEKASAGEADHPVRDASDTPIQTVDGFRTSPEKEARINDGADIKTTTQPDSGSPVSDSQTKTSTGTESPAEKEKEATPDNTPHKVKAQTEAQAEQPGDVYTAKGTAKGKENKGGNPVSDAPHSPSDEETLEYLRKNRGNKNAREAAKSADKETGGIVQRLDKREKEEKKKAGAGDEDFFRQAGKKKSILEQMESGKDTGLRVKNAQISEIEAKELFEKAKAEGVIDKNAAYNEYVSALREAKRREKRHPKETRDEFHRRILDWMKERDLKKMETNPEEDGIILHRVQSAENILFQDEMEIRTTDDEIDSKDRDTSGKKKADADDAKSKKDGIKNAQKKTAISDSIDKGLAAKKEEEKRLEDAAYLEKQRERREKAAKDKGDEGTPTTGKASGNKDRPTSLKKEIAGAVAHGGLEILKDVKDKAIEGVADLEKNVREAGVESTVKGDDSGIRETGEKTSAVKDVIGAVATVEIMRAEHLKKKAARVAAKEDAERSYEELRKQLQKTDADRIADKGTTHSKDVKPAKEVQSTDTSGIRTIGEHNADGTLKDMQLRTTGEGEAHLRTVEEERLERAEKAKDAVIRENIKKQEDGIRTTTAEREKRDQKEVDLKEKKGREAVIKDKRKKDEIVKKEEKKKKEVLAKEEKEKQEAVKKETARKDKTVAEQKKEDLKQEEVRKEAQAKTEEEVKAVRKEGEKAAEATVKEAENIQKDNVKRSDEKIKEDIKVSETETKRKQESTEQTVQKQKISDENVRRESRLSDIKVQKQKEEIRKTAQKQEKDIRANAEKITQKSNETVVENQKKAQEETKTVLLATAAEKKEIVLAQQSAEKKELIVRQEEKVRQAAVKEAAKSAGNAAKTQSEQILQKATTLEAKAKQKQAFMKAMSGGIMAMSATSEAIDAEKKNAAIKREMSEAENASHVRKRTEEILGTGRKGFKTVGRGLKAIMKRFVPHSVIGSIKKFIGLGVALLVLILFVYITSLLMKIGSDSVDLSVTGYNVSGSQIVNYAMWFTTFELTKEGSGYYSYGGGGRPAQVWLDDVEDMINTGTPHHTDCSGFVSGVLAHFNLVSNDYEGDTGTLQKVGTPVGNETGYFKNKMDAVPYLQPGDIVIFSPYNPSYRKQHVGFYYGEENGVPMIVNNTGTGVRKDTYAQHSYDGDVMVRRVSITGNFEDLMGAPSGTQGEELIYACLRQAGISHSAACGIMGNVMLESAHSFAGWKCEGFYNTTISQDEQNYLDTLQTEGYSLQAFVNAVNAPKKFYESGYPLIPNTSSHQGAGYGIFQFTSDECKTSLWNTWQRMRASDPTLSIASIKVQVAALFSALSESKDSRYMFLAQELQNSVSHEDSKEETAYYANVFFACYEYYTSSFRSYSTRLGTAGLSGGYFNGNGSFYKSTNVDSDGNHSDGRCDYAVSLYEKMLPYANNYDAISSFSVDSNGSGTTGLGQSALLQMLVTSTGQTYVSTSEDTIGTTAGTVPEDEEESEVEEEELAEKKEGTKSTGTSVANAAQEEKHDEDMEDLKERVNGSGDEEGGTPRSGGDEIIIVIEGIKATCVLTEIKEDTQFTKDDFKVYEVCNWVDENGEAKSQDIRTYDFTFTATQNARKKQHVIKFKDTEGNGFTYTLKLSYGEDSKYNVNAAAKSNKVFIAAKYGFVENIVENVGEINETTKITDTTTYNVRKYKEFYDKWKLDLSLSYFHGGFYAATIKGDSTTTYKFEDVENGQNVLVPAGTEVIVMYLRNGEADKVNVVCRLEGGKTVYVKKSLIHCTSQLYNSTTAYTNEQVEEWANRQNIPTEYSASAMSRLGLTFKPTPATKVFIASKYNQHGWILEGSNGNWTCVSGKCGFKISTGQLHPTDRLYKYPDEGTRDLPNDVYGFEVLGLFDRGGGIGDGRWGIYYSKASGSNSIHRAYYPGQPGTHGCIGVPDSILSYFADTNECSYGTRVVLF